MDEDLIEAVTAAERQVERTVQTALREVAEEFARALYAADELVAARFSIGRITRMWANRVPSIVRRLMGVAETSANHAADAVDAELPDTWRDLPGRYDDGRLPEGLGQYADVTEHLLRAVGDRLAGVARAELAEGLDAGESVDQLRARLRTAFARDGAQLGPVRRERIARTEATRAWNTATLEAARVLEGKDRPLVKQWLTRRDLDVRDAHDDVEGQLRLIDEPFTVAGVPMQAPGDPTAPPELVINCRCVLALARAGDRAATAGEPKDLPRVHASKSEEVTPVTPTNPGPLAAAADGSHLMGGMIALIPTAEDAARLAIEGGEDVDELHLTLYFLGDNGADWTEDQRNELAEGVRARVSELGGNVTGRAFGANHWNAGSDSPSWVWAVGDDRDQEPDAPSLVRAHALATAALEDTHERPELPVQHSPWVPHVCAAYSDDPGLLEALEERLGPITFDRLRLAFGGEHIDIPLTEEEPMNEDTTAAGMPTRAWSTPGDAGLAFENQQTGDGRVFAPGSLEWSGPGPWPLQYADEMLRGHEGAELAGAINNIGRDGDRITGEGVLYLTQRSGAEATMLLEEEAPLGVSVDLDDVDVEFVDRTLAEGEDGVLVLAASLASASLLRLDDGGWMLTSSTAPAWTASGGHPSRIRHTSQLITGPGGAVTAASVRAAFEGAGVLTAAAGDPDDPEAGVVVHSESSGDLLLRITRARLRGATLVAVPAYDRARIVLDPLDEEAEAAASAAGDVAEPVVAATGDTHQRVIAYVRACPAPVGPAEVARVVGVAVKTARDHLNRAVKSGHLVRMAPGLYAGASSMPEGQEVAASAAGTAVEPARVPHTHPVPDDVMGELVASAWSAMQDADPMPAEWFREPTEEELPPGSGGVHYAGGRIYGWVAQAGEPHAGFPGRNLTIESLGDLDMSHFLRARFKLDDGSFVRAGAYTMNVPHSRDGAECDSASCQFDDTRTVAGVITCGLNERGLWFSGAAAPWLSQWDRTVFTACQPSYHMRQGPGGKWQLRAVLSVPVPGHSSPLIAAAVERSNLALAASAAASPTFDVESVWMATDAPAIPVHVPSAGERSLSVSSPAPTPAAGPGDPAAITASFLERPELLDGLLDALTRRQAAREDERRAEVDRLSAAFAATPAGTPAAF
ncbi:capsid maturation protease and MuF-like fusion protein [Streptomyces phage TurkishDelight]|uniref:Capsid maturation protease and MuF-like fusion protein n=1 Tax=Streptomyces phage TurkishDelight TaxID=2793708 RepID=A0A7T0Q3E0_9CAUD|nr:capsid maturation protease and MuF-like fusion protein [Streptomyces phage TurkishDelight]QPL14044.1 capsid maturation protease and MuF-like fusion protein [Streptomyces phage TurkishDelight]